MDDPWGDSPWADEVQLPDTIKTKEAPRPATPIRTPKLGLEGVISSPWGDDDDNDEFGDWAALPEDQEQKLGMDGSVDDWGKHSADIEGLTNGHSDILSGDWPVQDAIGSDEPSTLAPSAFPRVQELVVRQPSPDPWKSTIQEEEGHLDDTKATKRQEKQTRDHAAFLPEERVASPVSQILQTSNETLVPESEPDQEGPASVGEDIHNNTVAQVSDAKGVLSKTSDGKTSSDSQESDPVSRPSSSRSERSQHNELLQESPRTSIDEEPKHSRPQVPRKVSTKVLELVQHFDTLGQTEDTEPVISQPTNQGADLEQNDDEDDFGDFEEGQSDDESLKVSDLAASRQAAIKSPKSETAQHQRTPSSESSLTKDYGVVEYEFDLATLDSIYPSDTPEPSADKAFVPDTIPFDSFSSVEQRKTWYRISRYGPMRKHNTGNDENYVRVSWKPSVIRDDTLKIVSRWIEEDRISGRVVLGGGSKGSTVFGWNDPKAPAVPLSDVFAKHGKKNSAAATGTSTEVPREWPTPSTRDRPTSKPESPTRPRRKDSVKAAALPAASEQQDPIAPAANFGWNSTSAAAQQMNIGPTASEKRLSKTILDPIPLSDSNSPLEKSKSSHASISSVPISVHEDPFQSPNLPAAFDTQTPLASSQMPVPLPNLSMSQLVKDDDDDWGEMVSTSVTPTLPDILPSKALRHKKSQSFGGMASNHSHGEASKGWDFTPTEPTHRPTSSFDEILIPQNLGAIPSLSQTTSNVDLFATPTSNTDAPVPVFQEPVVAASDPWASADFSFFDTAPVPTSAPKPIAPPSSKAVPKAVKFNAPPPASDRGNQRSREELEQDRIVQSVVKGLPDLSYMLRK